MSEYGLTDLVRTLDLPSGGTVHFRDPEEMTGQEYRDLLKMMGENTDKQTLIDFSHELAAALIDNWNIPYMPEATLPRENPALLGSLRVRDYKQVLMAIAAAVALVLGTEPTPDDANRPGSPTPPAGD